MLQSMQSKTVIGLVVILALSATLACLGKLTTEMVDVIKWVGMAYMGVRGVANYAESKAGGQKE